MKVFQYIIFFQVFCLVSSWTPIGSVYNLKSVSRVRIADKDYVVWKSKETGKFTVQDDVCPHRMAPLSEGRVEGNAIQCGYHGWEFDSRGNCQKVPQRDKQSQFACRLETFQTKVTGDILWAYIQENLPAHMTYHNATEILLSDKILQEADVPFIREVPYSWNFLMENFFDPAHIPFAHHGLQSVREDATPIPVQLLEMSESKLTFFFQDVTRGRDRDAKMEFFAPFHYKLRERNENEWIASLTLLCIPVEEGKSRVFLCDKVQQNDWTEEEKVMERVKNHHYSNQFFNTDDYIVHKQEINRSKYGNRYKMPTTSDYAVKMFQKWVQKYYEKWMYANQKEISREAALDNFEHHIKYCKDCQQSKPL